MKASGHHHAPAALPPERNPGTHCVSPSASLGELEEFLARIVLHVVHSLYWLSYPGHFK